MRKTDPDAAPMRRQGGGSAVLGYRDHYVVDGGKARIILSTLVSPASVMDNTPMLDLVDWVCHRWQLAPKIAAGDAKYGTVPNIGMMIAAGQNLKRLIKHHLGRLYSSVFGLLI